MSGQLILRPEAEADALEAYRWYNEQLPGLGEEFLAEIDRAPRLFSPIPKRLGSCIASLGASLPCVFHMPCST